MNLNSNAIRRLRSLLVLVAAAGLAFAASPRDALVYQSEEAAREAEALERARSALLQARVGLSGGVGLSPGFTYEGEFEPDDPGDPLDPAVFDFDVVVDLDIDYLYDRATILSRQLGLVDAEDDLADQIRDDVEDALIAHAELLRARLGLGAAAENLEEVRVDLQEAQARSATPAQLREAELRVQEEELDFEQAQVRLANARERAAAMGIGGNPTFEILRFELPEVAAEETHTFQLLRLALLRNQAEGLRDSVFDVFDNLTVTGGYEGAIAEGSLSLFVDNGRPGASLDAAYRGQSDEDRWFISVGADFRINSTTFQEFSTAEREAAELQKRVDDFVFDFPASVAAELRDVDYEWQDLQAARERFEIRRARLAEIQAQIDAAPALIAELQVELDRLRTLRDEAEGDARSDLDAQVRQVETDLRDTTRVLDRADSDVGSFNDALVRDEDTLYGEWINYVRAVGDYLALVDGTWAVAE